MKRFLYVILFSLFGLLSCSGDPSSSVDIGVEKNNSEEKQKSTLSSNLEDFLIKYPVSVVITDKSCISCNRQVVGAIGEVLGGENLGVVLETTGAFFDISPLLKEEFSDKVISDHKHQLSKKFEMEKTFILARDDVGKYTTTAISADNADQFESLLKASLDKK